MQQCLNMGIKDIIERFPGVDKILEEYNIGCAPCNVGSCLLKDIVDIHNLSPEDERELMMKIAGVIYPGKEVELPEIQRKEKTEPGQIRYSPPMKKLVDEHKLIKRWVALIPRVLENLDLGSEEGRQVITEGLDFIRNYADKYHHSKEEEILFKYFDENLDIINVMHADHETARAHVRSVLEGLDERNAKKIREHLNAYRELLTEHIKKEDEILYPWMDRNLADTQVGNLFSQFAETDKAFGDSPHRHEEFIIAMEKRFGKEK